MSSPRDYYPGSHKSARLFRVEYKSSIEATRRALELSPAAKRAVVAVLKSGLPTRAGGPVAEAPDAPGWLVYVLQLPGEASVGIVYRYEKKLAGLYRQVKIATFERDH